MDDRSLSTAGIGADTAEELEARLRAILEQIDAARGEMSAGEVDADLVREAGMLRRQIDVLRGRETEP